ncbi:MAG: hypothetical protein JWR46_3945 [Mycobacterium sp.]|nr:hypothetical protein [Mycobacterium sp.]
MDGVVRAEIADDVLGARHESCVIAGHLHRCRSALSPGESPQSLGQEVPCRPVAAQKPALALGIR